MADRSPWMLSKTRCIFWLPADIDALHMTAARQKALELNLDTKIYGTFAEIGASQEVVRWFLSVGGAAGTVVKTISAYDMAVSNALYGSSSRYISRQRPRSVRELLYAEEAAPLMDAGNTTFNVLRHSGELPSDFVAIRGADGFGDLGVHL
jgi:hypothetical protein